MTEKVVSVLGFSGRVAFTRALAGFKFMLVLQKSHGEETAVSVPPTHRLLRRDQKWSHPGQTSARRSDFLAQAGWALCRTSYAGEFHSSTVLGGPQKLSYCFRPTHRTGFMLKINGRLFYRVKPSDSPLSALSPRSRYVSAASSPNFGGMVPAATVQTRISPGKSIHSSSPEVLGGDRDDL